MDFSLGDVDQMYDGVGNSNIGLSQPVRGGKVNIRNAFSAQLHT